MRKPVAKNQHSDQTEQMPRLIIVFIGHNYLFVGFFMSWLKFVKKCFIWFSEWTEMFPYDFRDERMMKQLKEISQRVVSACPELRRDIGGITHNLLNKVKY